MGTDNIENPMPPQEANIMLLPGDTILATASTNGSEVAVVDGTLRATTACYSENRSGVLGLSSRFARLYTPYEGDSVVGIVLERYNDGYTVDIRAALPAFISATAFIGASKKNPLILRPGDAIYTRVTRALLGTQPQLTCAGEGYTPLAAVSSYGRVTPVTLAMSTDAGTFFAKLAKLIPFKAYSGPNGLVWTCGSTLYDSITVQMCISAPLEMDAIVQERASALSRQSAAC